MVINRKLISIVSLVSLLFTSCSNNKEFNIWDDKLTLPIPTKMSYKEKDKEEVYLKNDIALDFYNKYLKDIEFYKYDNIFINEAFTINLYYEYNEINDNDNPIIISISNFNRISCYKNHWGGIHRFMSDDYIPYLEMIDYLSNNL